jgi:hypothetical protein
MESEIFFAEGLDHPNQLESAGEISLRAHAISFAKTTRQLARHRELASLIFPSGKSVRGIPSIANPHGAHMPASRGEHRPLDLVTAAPEISMG